MFFCQVRRLEKFEYLEDARVVQDFLPASSVVSPCWLSTAMRCGHTPISWRMRPVFTVYGRTHLLSATQLRSTIGTRSLEADACEVSD